MANWRQDKDKKPTGKPAASKPNAAPKINSPAPSPKVSQGWRSQKKVVATATHSDTSKRSWNSAAKEVEINRPANLRKWLAVTALGLATCYLVYAFIGFIFPSSQAMPLMVLAVESNRNESYRFDEQSSNPFGKTDAEGFKQLATSNSRNLRVVLAKDSDGNDALLKEIGGNEKWFNNQAWSIRGGGPDGNVIAFYVSCAVVAKSIEPGSPQKTLFLVPADVLPYWPGQDSSQLLSMQKFLLRVAEALPKNTYAWIALDTKSTPVIAGLGDLDFPMEAYVESAFKGLSLDLQDRLVITLPCSDGQENWLSPEFSSTAFGHHFRKFLSGTYDPDRPAWSKLEWTLADLRERFDTKISDWVAIRRHAVQQPHWLMSEKTQKNAKNIRLFSTLNSTPATSLAIDKAKLRQRFETIDARWQLFRDSAENAWQWDPLGYAIVECNLLQLENLAESAAEQFDSFSNTIPDRIAELQRGSEVPRVSLIENATHYNRSKSLGLINFLKLESIAEQLSKDGAPFWKAEAQPNKEAAASVTDPNLYDRDERAWLVWSHYATSARSQSAAKWQSAFEKSAIDRALQFVDGASAGPSSTSTEWLEMQLLRMLSSEIDWERDSILKESQRADIQRQRARACALVVSTFEALQTLATRPNPEVSRWTAGSIQNLDRNNLRGLDWLLAGQYDRCIDEITGITDALRALEKSSESIESLLLARNRGYLQIPHLLAWLLREYQSAEPGEQLTSTKQQLESLGEAAYLVSRLDRAFREATPGPLVSALEAEVSQDGEQLNRLLNRLAVVDFDSYVGEKCSSGQAPKDNPQTHRRDRIALRSPLLNPDHRRQIHENVLNYLTSSINTSSNSAEVASKPIHRPAREGAQLFLTRLQDSSQRAVWDAIATGDVWSIIPETLRMSPVPNENNPEMLRQRLAEIESKLRPAAVAFGQWSSLRKSIGSWDSAWPWSAPVQRERLDQANYRLFQSVRLADARWGNGEIDSMENSYFYRLAEQYAPARILGTLKPVEQLSPALDALFRSKLRAAHLSLNNLRVQFGPENFTFPIGQKAVQSQFEVSSDSWPAIANVYLGKPSKPMPWIEDALGERGRPVELDTDESGEFKRKWQQTVDLALWSTESNFPFGSVAVRGNYRTQPIRWRGIDSRRDEFPLHFVLETPRETKLTVRPPVESPPLSVMLLLDCSESMGQEVKPEGKRLEPTQVFALARATAIGVVRELSRIHKSREADVQLGIMAFGLVEDPSSASLKKAFAKLRPDNHGSNQIFATDVQRVDLIRSGQLEDLLKSSQLQPSGCTPLYDAIFRAAKILATIPGKKMIYVISDGVDDTGSQYYECSQRSSKEEVIAKINSLNDGHLNIFFFNNVDWYTHKKEEAKQARGKNVLEQEFENKLSGRYNFDSSNSMDELLNKLRQAIPQTKITVTTSAVSKASSSLSAKLGETLVLPAGSAPCEAKIEISGPFGAADQRVQFVGGEHLFLDYDSRLSKLFFPKLTSLEVGFRSLHMRAWQKQQVWIQPVSKSNEIQFRIGFSEQDPATFTYRPGFLLAEVEREGGTKESTYFLPDFQFEQNKHFPIARTVSIPWPADASLARAPRAFVKLWVSAKRPQVVRSRQLSLKSPALTEMLGAIDIAMKRTDGLVEVVLRRTGKSISRQERLFVLCSQATEAVRLYMKDGSEEKHRFSLPKIAQSQDVEVALVTLSDLDAAMRNGDLEMLDFEAIEWK